MSERRSELKAVSAGEANGKAIEHDFMQMSARMMDGWSQVNTRLITLAQTSLRNNLTAADELRQCQSPREMVDCQMKLARQAYDDYLDEARHISDLVTKISTDAMGFLGMPR